MILPQILTVVDLMGAVAAAVKADIGLAHFARAVDDAPILNKRPTGAACATARVVVKHKGAPHPTFVACTLLP